jgi:hypothetical protein
MKKPRHKIKLKGIVFGSAANAIEHTKGHYQELALKSKMIIKVKCEYMSHKGKVRKVVIEWGHKKSSPRPSWETSD